MSPFISVTVYLFLAALEAFLTEVCLRCWRRTAGKAGRIRKFWLPPFLLLTLCPVAGAFLPDSPVKFALQAAGNIWLGFFVYYGVIVFLLLIFVLVRLITRGRPGKSWCGAILCISAAISAVIGVYGLIHAQHTVVKRYDLTIDKPGEDMKIVLLSDLHLSVNSHLSTIRKMVELVNAEQPDLVVIAGDIFTSSYDALSHPEQYAEVLSGIQAKYGVYAVYGNHDVEETLFGGFPISPISKAFRTKEMEQFFDDCGFITLKDELISLPGGVQLAGRIDGEKAGDGTKNRLAPDELLADADLSAPILVLQHEPVEFSQLKDAGADIALCGHTHAGQIFPGNLVVPYFNENGWGYKKVHDMHTLVSAGVGYYGPPMRVGTDSEITVLSLHLLKTKERK